MSYLEFLADDRRLAILRILAELPDHAANQFVLRRALETHGYNELVPTVHNDLLMLAKECLVVTESLPGGVLAAQLTDKGSLVARGLLRVAGVAAPAV